MWDVPGTRPREQSTQPNNMSTQNNGAEARSTLATRSARERRIREAIEELREKRDNCALHYLSFVPYMHKLTAEQRDQAEADLQCRFKLWWSTWIETQLKAIEAELPNVRDEPRGKGRSHSP